MELFLFPSVLFHVLGVLLAFKLPCVLELFDVFYAVIAVQLTSRGGVCPASAAQ